MTATNDLSIRHPYQHLDERSAQICRWRDLDATWMEIAHWIGISDRQAQRIHAKALLTIADKLKEQQ